MGGKSVRGTQEGRMYGRIRRCANTQAKQSFMSGWLPLWGIKGVNGWLKPLEALPPESSIFRHKQRRNLPAWTDLTKAKKKREGDGRRFSFMWPECERRGLRRPILQVAPRADWCKFVGYCFIGYRRDEVLISRPPSCGVQTLCLPPFLSQAVIGLCLDISAERRHDTRLIQRHFVRFQWQEEQMLKV